MNDLTESADSKRNLNLIFSSANRKKRGGVPSAFLTIHLSYFFYNQIDIVAVRTVRLFPSPTVPSRTSTSQSPSRASWERTTSSKGTLPVKISYMYVCEYTDRKLAHRDHYLSVA